MKKKLTKKEQRKSKNESYRIWYLKNKEKKKEYQRKYNIENAEKRNEYFKARYQENKEEINAKARASYRKNKKKRTAEYRARYEKQRKKCGGNPWAKTRTAYRKKNKGLVNAFSSGYRALKINAILPTTDLKQIKSIYKECVKVSERTKTKHEVDHIIPLSKGGAHHQDNLQIITETENQTKNNNVDLSLGGVWAGNKLARKNKKKYEAL